MPVAERQFVNLSFLLWKPLLFADEAPADEGREREPVASAKRSAAALAKTQNRRLADGTPALSFRGLLTHLATIVPNTMRPSGCRHRGTEQSCGQKCKTTATIVHGTSARLQELRIKRRGHGPTPLPSSDTRWL